MTTTPAHDARRDRCTCDPRPGEPGPEQDCPAHGDPLIFADEVDRLRKEATEVRAAARAELEDQRAAKRTAAESADRFRDVVADCLGHADENPGDDALIAELRAHFGRTGPEPTGWRDRLVGYEAARDQINAAARTDNTTGA